MDCDGTADGETYARLGRCLEAPNFNVLSNNNRQVYLAESTEPYIQDSTARRKCPGPVYHEGGRALELSLSLASRGYMEGSRYPAVLQLEQR